MEPFFMGLAAAEFLPADPEIWFDAAVAASVCFGRWKDGVIVDDKNLSDTGKFLLGQLYGTEGGREALAAFMDARGIEHVVLQAD